jgi:membrane-anchored protein YejM (alkaline phosphatase superfamily)
MGLTFWRKPEGGIRENFLLCTFDSCRFDSFVKARTPVLDQFGSPKLAYTQATYTLPAHLAMFAGFLPHVFEEEPFYNRFIRQMWRIEHRHVNTPPLVRFQSEARNIVDGFSRIGHYTVGVAAMAWFRTGSPLRNGFKFFERTKTNARKQVQLIGDHVARNGDRPFFAFINFGETHYPYTYEGMPGVTGDPEERSDLARQRNPKGVREPGWTFDEKMWQEQITCVEFLDAKLGELLRRFDQLGVDVTVVVCGDHGECLGEDGMFGHGFYHPKVMEVPMLMFKYEGSKN